MTEATAEDTEKSEKDIGYGPGAYKASDGKLYRDVLVPSPRRGGRPHMSRRPVSTDLKEAQDKRLDIYLYDLGTWLREGYKQERDRDPEDIMRSGTLTAPPKGLEE